MSGRSVVRMGSGVCSVCHVIISTDQGLGIGCPAPKHHSRVPVAQQSRGDVTGRQYPMYPGIQSAVRRGASGPFQLTPAMATCRPLFLHPEHRRSFFPSSGEPPLPGVCRRRTRYPHTSPESSRPAQCYSPDSNFSWTPPVERRVGGLVFEGPRVVDKWAILGRG